MVAKGQPEFPNGTYRYYVTDSYPYCKRYAKGIVETTGGTGPDGNPTDTTTAIKGSAQHAKNL